MKRFEDEFPKIEKLRRRALKSFKRHTHEDNIRFDGFARACHVTDATDWRVEFPFAVLTPDSESEIPDMVRDAVE